MNQLKVLWLIKIHSLVNYSQLIILFFLLNLFKMEKKTIELAVECQRIEDTLPRVKWILPTQTLIKQLLAECMIYLQEHFDQILQSSQYD